MQTLLVALILLMPLATACMQKTAIIRTTPDRVDVSASVYGPLGMTAEEADLEVDLNRLDCYFEPSCERTLIFTKEGYREQHVQSVFTARKTYIHVKLQPLETVLSIRTYPASAATTVTTKDGYEVDYSGTAETPHDKVPLDSESVWNGRDRITAEAEVSAPGYATFRKDIDISRYKVNNYSFVLKKLKAKLTFITDPPAVDVYDQYLGYLGQTPFTIGIPVEELIRTSSKLFPSDELQDNYQLHLIFVKEGYKTKEATRWIRTDEVTTTLREQLQKAE